MNEMDTLREDPPGLSGLSRGRILWLLFFNFLKIATFVLGGGYAIVLAAENIFIRKLHWLRDGELMDMLAIIQTIPGLMAGNAAIYVGYRAAGRLGALVALTGVALPSFTIITLISLGFSHLPMENVYVQGAFIGVRSALGGLTLAALLRIWKKTVRGCLGALIISVCFIGVTFFAVNPAWLLFGAMGTGIAWFLIGCHRLDMRNLTEDHKI